MAITVNRARGFVDFCTDLGLRAEWETANEALVKARQAGGDMLVDVAGAEAAAAVRALEDRMSAAMLRFEIQALTRKRWQELGVEHPPREGNANDASLGVDTSSFFDVVAVESILKVNAKDTDEVVDFDPAAEWVPLADEMTNGAYNEFVEKFLELNRGKGSAVPFSKLASVVTKVSEKK